jgi:hypothetical protein
MNATPIDVPRLIRIATVLFAMLAGTCVYFFYEPQTEAAEVRLNDAQTSILSQDVAFGAMSRLRMELAALVRHYDTPFVRNPEAVFLRELASTATRHGVTLVSTSVAQDPTAEADASHPAFFRQTQVALELRGTYRNLLATVRDLSNGSAIVAVNPPTLRRDNGALLATIPVTIYEPSETQDADTSAGPGTR